MLARRPPDGSVSVPQLALPKALAAVKASTWATRTWLAVAANDGASVVPVAKRSTQVQYEATAALGPTTRCAGVPGKPSPRAPGCESYSPPMCRTVTKSSQLVERSVTPDGRCVDR